MKRLTILGPAYPYRGGLATILETLADTFMRRGAEVDIKTFTVQYPQFLFPGKSQYRNTLPPENIAISREVNTVNPLNWIREGRRIRRDCPDVLLMKYWTPFMAPCFGTIARIARKNGHTKVIVHLDNIVPHEHHIIDRLFNKYFIGSCDGFVYMSEQVKRDLDSFTDSIPAVFTPHPLFENYGAKVSKQEACAVLGIKPELDYALFFGYIRDYKGLDLLIESWALLKRRGIARGRKLLVAGEFYGSGDKYLAQIERLGLGDDVVLHTTYIDEDKVRYYFCAADLVVQPYRTATQSGVTQVAYYYDVPMIVTDVGGLAEIVKDDVAGYVTEVSPESIADAMERFYSDGNAERLRANLATEKLRFSWEAVADAIESLE